MKKIVLFALIAAICAGALLYFYLDKLEQQKEVKVEYENVVVATANIPAYTPITTDMVTIRQVPLGTAHSLAARTLEEVVGYVTESETLEGEQLLPPKLKQLGQTESGLSYIIPEGMRAVTIPVDEVTGVAGFLQRGDYVDVITNVATAYAPSPVAPVQADTVQTEDTASADNAAPAAQTGDTERATTLVAAQNVRIAALGTSLTNGSGTNADGAISYGSITLFLTPEEAMRVLHASRSGAVMIILRASGDHDENTQLPVINDMLLEKAE